MLPSVARFYAAVRQIKRGGVWFRQQKPDDLIVAIQRDPYVVRIDACLDALLITLSGQGYLSAREFPAQLPQAHRK
jgi:hypothetical protein